MKKLVMLLVLTGMVLCQGCAQTVIGPLSGKSYLMSQWNGQNPDWAYWVEVREAYVSVYPEKEERIKKAILSKRVVMGMTCNDVIMAWLYKSDTLDINRTTGSWGVHEQWVYDECGYRGLARIYLYFKNWIFLIQSCAFNSFTCKSCLLGIY